MGAFSHFIDPLTGRQYGDAPSRGLSGIPSTHFLAPLPVPPSKRTPEEIAAAKACVEQFRANVERRDGAS